MEYQVFTDFSRAINHSEDYFLLDVCGKLQISNTLFELANEKYQAISKWLSGATPTSILHGADIRIVPHGSFGTGTINKPYKKDEYDLDAFIEVTSSKYFTPEELKEGVLNRLQEHKYYRGIIEEKSRCLRLNYVGQFHLDLMCAIPSRNQEGILVPEKNDLNQYEWSSSNPEGLGVWFDEKSKLYKTLKNDMSEREFDVVPIPELQRTLTPLHYSVQLLKRTRDVYFKEEKKGKKAVKSIILLTKLAEMYSGERSVGQVLRNSIHILEELIKEPIVRNPKNPQETFSDIWNEDTHCFMLFCEWVNFVKQELFLFFEGENYVKKIEAHKNLFGENISNSVVSDYGIKMQENQKAGQLSVNSVGGLVIGSAGSEIPLKRKVQHYGDSRQ